MTFIDDLESRIVRIEESLQIGECPPLDGCHPHRDIEEDQKHTPRLHASIGEHSEGGRDPLTDVATQFEDVTIEKQGPRYIMSTGLGTDPQRWAWTVDDDGSKVYLQYWNEPGGPWVTVATWDDEGNFKPEGGIDIEVGEVTLNGDPPCLIWHRTIDDDEYRMCATTLGLTIEAQPGGVGGWQHRVTIPRDGWAQGSLLAGNDVGGMEEHPLGPTGFGLAADPGSPLGLAWSNFGTPTSQAPGLCPLGGTMPYGGNADPGLQADGSQWFLCDGRTLLDSNHPALFAVIGYNFGGAGSSFDIPDMTDRVAIGIGAIAADVGDVVGAETHQHDVLEVPLHTHIAVAASHAHTVDAHNHNVNVAAHSHGSGSLAAASHDHGSGSLAVDAHNHTVALNHGHDISDPQHDHQSGSYVTAGHQHGAGTLQLVGRGVVSVDTGGGASSVLRDVAGGNTPNVEGNTASAVANIQGTSGTRATGITVDDFTGNVNSGNASPDVSGSTGSSSASVSGATDNGGAINQASGNASPGTSGAVVAVTIEDAGQADAETEAGSSIQPGLGMNWIIRVL